MIDKEKLETLLAVTVRGLDATYEHYKDKYSNGTQGHSACSRIPAVKHLVETFIIEINNEKDNMQHE